MVVTVLSILTLNLGLSLGVGDRGRRADTDALARLDAQLRDAALFGREVTGFRATGTGLQPIAAGPGGWNDTGAPLVWQAEARWQATVDSRPVVVAYLPDGRNTPFSVTFRVEGVALTCASDGWSPVSCSAR